MEISEQGRISESADGSFSVPSQTGSSRIYRVTLIHNEWTCDCPDFFYRHVMCKHVYAVRFFITMNHYIKQEIAEPKILADDAVQCVRCGSIQVMRYGRSANKQVFKCKDCGKKFREETDLDPVS